MSTLILVFMEIIIGIALVPLTYNFVQTANITDANGALLVSLIPFFFILLIVYKTAKQMM